MVSMYKSTDKMDSRVLRSRKALEMALIRLLERRPFEKISIRDIVKEAQLGYTTFFRHHSSKDELLNHIAKDQMRSLFNLAMPIADAYDIKFGAQAIFNYVFAHRPVWVALLTGGAASTIRSEFLNMASEATVTQEAQDRWLPADAGVILIIGGTLDLLTWWLSSVNPLPIERMADILVSTVIEPVIKANRTTQSGKRK